VNAHRGRLGEAERWVTLLDEFSDSPDSQERAGYACGRARLLLARGDAREALASALTALDASDEMGMFQEYVKEALVTALEASLALGDAARASELLTFIDQLPSGNLPQFLRAQSLRFRARLAGISGDEDADRLFKQAAGLFHELAMPFHLAVTRLEHAEWLTGERRSEEATPLLEEARSIFDELGAAPWLERAESVAAAAQTTA